MAPRTPAERGIAADGRRARHLARTLCDGNTGTCPALAAKSAATRRTSAQPRRARTALRTGVDHRSHRHPAVGASTGRPRRRRHRYRAHGPPALQGTAGPGARRPRTRRQIPRTGRHGSRRPGHAFVGPIGCAACHRGSGRRRRPLHRRARRPEFRHEQACTPRGRGAGGGHGIRCRGMEVALSAQRRAEGRRGARHRGDRRRTTRHHGRCRPARHGTPTRARRRPDRGNTVGRSRHSGGDERFPRRSGRQPQPDGRQNRAGACLARGARCACP